MPLGWMDVGPVPFDAVSLLERVQMKWLMSPSRFDDLAVALRHNPSVTWCIRTKCPEVDEVVADLLEREIGCVPPEEVRQAEIRVLDSIQDWLIYVLDPDIYDRQPFLRYDSRELLDLVDFSGKTVLDVGAGTGRLTFAAAPIAAIVYACEPVANLRDYLWRKAERLGQRNVYPTDGLITRLPFADSFFDVTMSGHVFGDSPNVEESELYRVTRPGGLVILCPGNNDTDDDRHSLLVERGYAWSRFEEPGDGIKRKYWKEIPWHSAPSPLLRLSCCSLPSSVELALNSPSPSIPLSQN